MNEVFYVYYPEFRFYTNQYKKVSIRTPLRVFWATHSRRMYDGMMLPCEAIQRRIRQVKSRPNRQVLAHPCSLLAASSMNAANFSLGDHTFILIDIIYLSDRGCYGWRGEGWIGA
jgi:hypothetical protein